MLISDAPNDHRIARALRAGQVGESCSQCAAAQRVREHCSSRNNVGCRAYRDLLDRLTLAEALHRLRLHPGRLPLERTQRSLCQGRCVTHPYDRCSDQWRKLTNRRCTIDVGRPDVPIPVTQMGISIADARHGRCGSQLQVVAHRPFWHC